MAPDLNAVAAGEKFDYSQFGSSGYHVKQDVTWLDPNNRKLRVLTIGGGVSGILMAYQIQKYCSNVEHVIYEKNADIGGTWLENRYPGCACDIPSHAYTYQFALNPDWPRFFSYSPDIWKYLDKVCNTFDLRKYMHFRSEVVGCYWNEEKGQWRVKIRETQPGTEPREFEDHCDLLLHGTGILNNFKVENSSLWLGGCNPLRILTE
nr:putative sterigmatocystin biosynthesis monooxygenase stcw [Quercus suber]